MSALPPATPTRSAPHEAYTKDAQLETALEADIPVTTRDDYASDSRRTSRKRSRTRPVSKRIKQLGGNPETVTMPGPEGLGKAAESVSDFVGKAKAAAQGPLHTVRGGGEQEKMLRNARTQYQNEAYEIATYTVIESLATAVGDKATAKVARDILRQEERMQEFLGALLPELSVDVAHDEIPVSEIQGEAERGSRPKTKTKTTKVTTKTKAKPKRRRPGRRPRRRPERRRAGPHPDRAQPRAARAPVSCSRASGFRCPRPSSASVEFRPSTPRRCTSDCGRAWRASSARP